MESKGSEMMFVGHALDHPSGTYKFNNPITDAIVVSNIVRWREFKPLEAENLEEAIRTFNVTALGNMKEFNTPSVEINLEPNVVNNTPSEMNETD